MKRLMLAVLVAALGLSFISPLAAADTGGMAVKPVMQKLPPIMQELQAKVDSRDYFGAAERFMDIARLFKSLETVVPAQGNKAQWDQIHTSIINAAFKGIGACGSRDDAAIKQAMQEIAALSEKGHSQFIPKKP
jgi:hypothetical protein